MSKHKTAGYDTRVTQVTVGPTGAGMYEERSWRVELDDGGGGEYVVVHETRTDSRIEIDRDEWPALRAAIGMMMDQARGSADD